VPRPKHAMQAASATSSANTNKNDVKQPQRCITTCFCLIIAKPAQRCSALERVTVALRCVRHAHAAKV
jgi:hypothetical protein